MFLGFWSVCSVISLTYEKELSLELVLVSVEFKLNDTEIVCLFVDFPQTAEQVTLFCRQQIEYSDDEEPKQNIQLSQAEKLRKVIIELVDTERSYVKVY